MSYILPAFGFLSLEINYGEKPLKIQRNLALKELTTTKL